jgi:hypothetical protein
MKIIRIFLGLVGIITIILIMYAGYTWMTSAGNAEKIDTAKKTLRNAAIGLLIIFSAFSIVSFIIRMLEGGFGPGGPGPGGQQITGCENCGHLGSGIIQSVYPVPLARDVPRDTRISITFKVIMDPRTIIQEINSANPIPETCTTAQPCNGILNVDNVKIYPWQGGMTEAQIDAAKLASAKVRASSADGLTYTFNPVDYLGDGTNNIWYAVKLGSGVKKNNGDSAFPGSNNYFLWRFEIGTNLDLDPPELTDLFPVPDSRGDVYSQTPGQPATGQIVVNARPSLARNAQVEAVRTAPAPAAGGPRLIVNGSYNGTYEGTATVILNSGATKTTATVNWEPNRGNMPDGDYPLTNGTLVLGDGITVSFVDTDLGADAWDVTLTPYSAADAIRVANKVYTFGTDILIHSTSTAANVAHWIAEKINSDTLTPALTVTVVGNTVNLTAGVIGRAGNFTVNTVPAGAAWATTSGTNGTDPVFGATTQGTPDQPRNVIITLNFSEAVDPIQVQTNQAVFVQYNTNSDPSGAANWQTVTGKFLLSNQLKTVEFIPESQCKTCFGGTRDRLSCSTDSDCNPGGTSGAVCQPTINSCGDPVYCLPTLDDGNTTNASPRDATRYRVVVKAGVLKTCDTSNPCKDPNFNNCVATPGTPSISVCQGTFNNGVLAFYPKAVDPANGLIDMSSNSLNGNENVYVNSAGKIFGRTEGPGYVGLATEANNQSGKPAYQKNKVCSNDHAKLCLGEAECGAGNSCVNLPEDQGDHFVSYFYIGNKINLEPPKVLSVGPSIGAQSVSLTLPVESLFSDLMMSSTIKPGSTYRDGYCYCDQNSDCDQTGGEKCVQNKCKNEVGQKYCEENKECKTKRCLNKRYISLINPSTFQVGWWMQKSDIDVALPAMPLDGFGDRTQAQLNHTKFAEVTEYATEIGSGVKNIYQSCYLPSEGPKAVPGNISYTHCSVSAQTACTIDADCPLGEHCANFCDPNNLSESCCSVASAVPYCCNGSNSNIPCRHCSGSTGRSCDNNNDCPNGEKCVY